MFHRACSIGMNQSHYEYMTVQHFSCSVVFNTAGGTKAHIFFSKCAAEASTGTHFFKKTWLGTEKKKQNKFTRGLRFEGLCVLIAICHNVQTEP